jgi:6,7-dimethyl-8-ribityllumazine synthase
MRDVSAKKGGPSDTKLTIAILASRYHREVTEKLVAGAKKELERRSVSYRLFWLPGAYEIPQASQAAAVSGEFDGIVTLGCLIRGETSHFEFIAQTVATALDTVGRTTGVAVSFGVLTVDSMAQALARAGGAEGNKGQEAAAAAVELTLTQKEILKHGKPKKSQRARASSSIPY